MQFYLSEDIELIYTENICNEFKLHNHTKHVVVSMVMKGCVKLYYNNINIVCNEFDTFIIRPYMPHSVVIEKDAKLLSICINKNCVTLKNKECIIQQINNKINTTELSNIITQQLQEKLLESVEYIFESSDSLCVDIPTEILEIANKIEQQADCCISLNQLSDEVFVSKYHLVRKFKAKFGLTPHQFLIQIRIRKSQKSIASGNRLIDAALDNGFFDSSHFSKCFEKIVGVSPLNYKKAINK
ncbi:MAG: AraC family transcriptional regulator [Bacteroidales bacterium]|nr:AraC family transcriptional regulator [Bacteroidales bacterium]